MSHYPHLNELKDSIKEIGGEVSSVHYEHNSGFRGEACYLEVEGVSERSCTNVMENFQSREYIVYEEDNKVIIGVKTEP